ncbi:hypothetical protein [Tenacibaculum sp. A30]|uniref:hypothetical protein n=1 Tax=Tenacibaculum sp. A30 TaxID=3442644 RepID=UPI003EBA9426
MKNYSIIKLSSAWSTSELKEKTEKIVNEKSAQGYEIISVSFGINSWWAPTAFITICK